MRRAFSSTLLGLCLLLTAYAAAEPSPANFRTTEGLVIGRVFLDLNEDGHWSSGDLGLSKVRLWTSEGTEVLTDNEGRYHMGRLETGHDLGGQVWLKLDSSSLPAGTSMPDGGRRLVQLTPLAVVRVDFPLGRASWSKPAVRAIDPAPNPEDGLATPRASDEIETWLQGACEKNCRVTVDGQAATIADGGFRARIRIRPGLTRSLVIMQCPNGRLSAHEALTFWRRRQQGDLILPGPNRNLLSCQGPNPLAVPPASSLRLRCKVQTELEVELGDQRNGDLPTWRPVLILKPGINTFPLRIKTPHRVFRGQTDWQVERDFLKGALSGTLGLRLGLGDGDRGLVWGGRLRGKLVAELPWDLKLILQGRADSFETAGSSVGELTEQALAPSWDPWTFQRAADPEGAYWLTGDQSITQHSNHSLGRYSLSLKRGDSSLAWGQILTDDAISSDEVGQFRQVLHGAYARLRLLEPWFPDELAGVDLRVEGFYARSDPWTHSTMASYGPISTEGLLAKPAHEEFLTTGGTLYFLGHAWVVEGSERLVLHQRDRRTGMQLSVRRLKRGVDYQLDHLGGRILLTEPLDAGHLSGSPIRLLAGGNESQVLVVDYVFLDPSGVPGRDQAYGGGFRLDGRPVDGLHLSAQAGGMAASGSQAGEYRLLRSKLEVSWEELGRIWATWADSRGQLLMPAYSVDGGLSMAQAPTAPDALGEAYEAGADLFFGSSQTSLRFRRQLAGFADSARLVADDLTQFLASSQIQLGSSWNVSGRFASSFWEQGTLWEGKAQLAYAPLADLSFKLAGIMDAAKPADDLSQGFRRGFGDGQRALLGLHAQYRVLDWLSLLAGHQQSLLHEGQGAMGRNLSLSTLGFQLAFPEKIQVGVEGGWGPELGNLLRLNLGEDRPDGTRIFAATTIAPDSHGIRYGGLSSGQSASMGETGWRLGTAQHVGQEPGAQLKGQTLSLAGPIAQHWRLRLAYERSELQAAGEQVLRLDQFSSGFWDRALDLAALAAPGRRNAVFGAVGYLGEAFQTEIAGEYRVDEHLPLVRKDLWDLSGPDQHRQTVLRMAMAWQPSPSWSMGGRVAWAESFGSWTGQDGPGLPEGGFLEASLGLAYRPSSLRWFRMMLRAAGGREQRPWPLGPENAYPGSQDWFMTSLALLFEPAPWLQPTLVAAPFLREFRYTDGRKAQQQTGLLTMLRIGSELWGGLGLAVEGRLQGLWQEEGLLPESDAESLQMGLACEIFYQLKAGPSVTRLALGYSFSDVPDPMLQDLNAGNQGLYLRLEGGL